jgi:hypothetical protein
MNGTVKRLAVFLGVLLLASRCHAIPNPNVSLAMHTIAVAEYLDRDDLDSILPECLGEIDQSATIADLDASSGNVYVALLACGAEAVSSVEFCIEGWPSGPDSPRAICRFWQLACRIFLLNFVLEKQALRW